MFMCTLIVYGAVSFILTHFIFNLFLQTQKRCQGKLLNYVQLNEVLALLKPSKLPMIRQSYSQLVSEGILTKKRMKGYFASLPGKSSVKVQNFFTNELKEYATVALPSNTPIEPGTANTKPVEAKDIDNALSELLPVANKKKKKHKCQFVFINSSYFVPSILRLRVRYISLLLYLV